VKLRKKELDFDEGMAMIQHLHGGHGRPNDLKNKDTATRFLQVWFPDDAAYIEHAREEDARLTFSILACKKAPIPGRTTFQSGYISGCAITI